MTEWKVTVLPDDPACSLEAAKARALGTAYRPPGRPKGRVVAHGTVNEYSNHKCRCDECRAAWAAYYRASGYRSKYHLRKKYGLTPEGFDEMLKAQNGVCAICAKPSDRKLHVDHDHSCCAGELTCGACVRGLLCNQCNFLLGAARDDPAILAKAMEYLGVEYLVYSQAPGNDDVS